MKVGLDARGAVKYRGTGIGTYTYQLIKHLQGLGGQEYRLFWPGEEYLGLTKAGEHELQQLEIHHEAYWEEIFIPKGIMEEKIDIFHVPQNGIGLPKKKYCGYVVTIHDLIPYLFPETVGKGYLKEFLEQMPHIVERADKIITVSHCTKQDLMDLLDVPSEKIEVIYEAPEPFYRPMPKELARDFIKENYGIQGRYILYLGGFSPRKNLRVLFNAYRQLLKDTKEPPVQLVLVGRESKEQKDTQTLAELSNVKGPILWPGYVPSHHLPYFYNGADIFIYPSLYEGFGLPPLEAMACGTPTITSRISSIPEVVADGAILVNPYDHLELAGEMFKLIDNDVAASILGAKGLARAKDFSWCTTAKKTAQVYKQLWGNMDY